MTKPWIFETNSIGFNFCRSILIQLVSRFPIKQDDGIGLINSRWGHITLIDQDNIAYHETPEFWAKEFYWGSDAVWWKPEDERKLMNLHPLKPIREDREAEYELWENNQSEEFIFISSIELTELMKNNLINDSFLRTWITIKQNYNEGLKELYKYKGWNKYKEIS